MNISFGPDGNTITDSQLPRTLYLTDTEGVTS